MATNDYVPAMESLDTWAKDVPELTSYIFWAMFLRDKIATGEIAAKGYKEGRALPEKVDPELAQHMLVISIPTPCSVNLIPGATGKDITASKYTKLMISEGDVERLVPVFHREYAEYILAAWQMANQDEREYFNIWAYNYYSGSALLQDASFLEWETKSREKLLDGLMRTVLDRPEIMPDGIKWAEIEVKLPPLSGQCAPSQSPNEQAAPQSGQVSRVCQALLRKYRKSRKARVSTYMAVAEMFPDQLPAKPTGFPVITDVSDWVTAANQKRAIELSFDEKSAQRAMTDILDELERLGA